MDEHLIQYSLRYRNDDVRRERQRRDLLRLAAEASRNQKALRRTKRARGAWILTAIQRVLMFL